MHHMDTNKMYKRKAKWEQHKNVSCYFEQILKIPNKTAAVWLLASHLTNSSSKINKTCRALLEKQGLTYKRYSLIDSHTWTCQCWPKSKVISSVQTQNAA